MKDAKSIKKRYSNNALFNAELKKRKNRTKAVGGEFKSEQLQEFVWLDLTFRLKEWEINKGYDSFIYMNNKEGKNEEAYITLKPDQLKRTNKSYVFCREKYIEEIPALIEKMVLDSTRKSASTIYNALWAMQDPMSYWKLKN